MAGGSALTSMCPIVATDNLLLPDNGVCSNVSSPDPIPEESVTPSLGSFIPDRLEGPSTSSMFQHSSLTNSSGFMIHDSIVEDGLPGSTCQELPLKEASSTGAIEDLHLMEKASSCFIHDHSVNDSYHAVWNQAVGTAEKAVRSPSPDLHDIPEASHQNMQEIVCAADGLKTKSAQDQSKKRDGDLHQLIFKENGLPDLTELLYCHKGEIMLQGYKFGNGIICCCCKELVSPSIFEAHAGFPARRQPYHNICTSNGLTLHELSLSLSNGEKLKYIRDDDTCILCGDCGNLILCDGCRKTFHAACLGSQCVSNGECYCPYCSDSSTSSESPLNGTGTGSITPRVIRVAEVPAYYGCLICRSRHCSIGVFNSDTMMMCDQCDKEYHVRCLRENGLGDLKEYTGSWFCCNECSAIHTALQNFLSKGAETVPKFILHILTRNVEDVCMRNKLSEGVRWQLLSGKVQSNESKQLLSKAAAIFRKGFAPIDGPSNCDLVPALLYGRTVEGHYFEGIYCAILTIRSVVVSAGIIRIMGKEAAELPLVATAEESRRKGYFRCLFSCIEMLLSCLGVNNIILPAAEDSELMWKNSFGFTMMPHEKLKKYMVELPLITFKGTTMLESPVHQFFR